MQERETSSEEQAEAGAAVEQPTHRRRGWLSALVAGVTVVAVVVAFAIFALGRQTSAQVSPQRSQPAAVASWRIYHDPLGLFTMRTPPGWTASDATIGTFTMSSRTGSMSGKSEEMQFSDPAQGDGSARIEVTAFQINSDFGRQWYCGARSQETSTFNDYRAQEMFPHGTVWLFESNNAHFQVDVAIPGVFEPPHTSIPVATPPPTPTPLPQAMVQADESLLDNALASFQPSDKSLTCG